MKIIGLISCLFAFCLFQSFTVTDSKECDKHMEYILNQFEKTHTGKKLMAVYRTQTFIQGVPGNKVETKVIRDNNSYSIESPSMSMYIDTLNSITVLNDSKNIIIHNSNIASAKDLGLWSGFSIKQQIDSASKYASSIVCDMAEKSSFVQINFPEKFKKKLGNMKQIKIFYSQTTGVVSKSEYDYYVSAKPSAISKYVVEYVSVTTGSTSKLITNNALAQVCKTGGILLPKYKGFIIKDLRNKR